MVGFSNLDETQDQTSITFSTTTIGQRLNSIQQTWKSRSTLEKGLLVAVVALSFLSLGLIIGLAVSGGKGSDTGQSPSPSPDVCLTPDCTRAASRILESVDQSANPCSDFYAYACGTWKKTHAVPDESTKINTMSVLRDKTQLTNKNLYEDPGNVDANENAWKKAKNAYASCMDTDTIEQKNLSAITIVLRTLGGWPVLGLNPGGNWNERGFDLVSLLVALAQYKIQPIMQLDVVPDSKNSTQLILQLAQPSLKNPVEADLIFAKSMAIRFGASPTQADADMRNVMEFRGKLYNITMSLEDIYNPDLTYNKMTLAEIRRKFKEPRGTDPIQFNWSNYVRGIMDAVRVNIADNEQIIVTTVSYFDKLFWVLQQYSKRTVANFIMWSFMKDPEMALALPELATSHARWRDCERTITKYMGFAISQKFVKQTFNDITRQKVEEMVKNIKRSFTERLQDVTWMDVQTRSLAKEKAEAIKDWIGYPDELFNDTVINEIYKNISIDKNTFFENLSQFRKNTFTETMKMLRKPFNKLSALEVWSQLSPITVNAAYVPNFNDIIISAAILQSPYYKPYQPQSINYGGIGTVIGHEITHGFDNVGRKYDKYGNLKQWWNQKIIDNFNEQARCMVNQYSSYVVPEANITINGNLTLGENIADNGGLKQSYRAYQRWVLDQGKDEPKLPGLDLTNNQIFFVSFAQIWCKNMNRQAAQIQISTDTHSPDQFRVIGTLQNSEKFAAAFSCPRKSYMNPEKKCSVW